MMIAMVTFAAALAFDSLSKEWRRKPKPRKGLMKRTVTLSFCIFLYLGLWTSYLYFNGKITDSEGTWVKNLTMGD